MKYKTTRKAIVAMSPRLVSAGYCDLQCLLRNHAPIAYTSGVYGWNYDVYNVYGLTICTGYRGMPGPTAKGIREYKKRAREIVDAHWADWKKQDEAIEALLIEFCNQADKTED